jgi:hypothetical protein
MLQSGVVSITRTVLITLLECGMNLLSFALACAEAQSSSTSCARGQIMGQELDCWFFCVTGQTSYCGWAQLSCVRRQGLIVVCWPCGQADVTASIELHVICVAQLWMLRYQARNVRADCAHLRWSNNGVRHVAGLR